MTEYLDTRSQTCREYASNREVLYLKNNWLTNMSRNQWMPLTPHNLQPLKHFLSSTKQSSKDVIKYRSKALYELVCTLYDIESCLWIQLRKFLFSSQNKLRLMLSWDLNCVQMLFFSRAHLLLLENWVKRSINWFLVLANGENLREIPCRMEQLESCQFCKWTNIASGFSCVATPRNSIEKLKT